VELKDRICQTFALVFQKHLQKRVQCLSRLQLQTALLHHLVVLEGLLGVVELREESNEKIEGLRRQVLSEKCLDFNNFFSFVRLNAGFEGGV